MVRMKHKVDLHSYMRNFLELMLQIPSMSEQESLFWFIDKLHPWTQLELAVWCVESCKLHVQCRGTVEFCLKHNEPKEKVAMYNKDLHHSPILISMPVSMSTMGTSVHSTL